MASHFRASTKSLSRARLEQLANWIRDDLDLLVAREGPDALHPDDCIFLHEFFISLRQAHHLTVSDLRATGIHKAISDISGVATRWPARLCDDCDRILSIWSVKFGSLTILHPFLYGRGGRLEGIASSTEYSKEALLKRWAQSRPSRIAPKQSHQVGDLGFRAGSWWINPLFAHHAGIIGLESVEGGTTFDKDGAYALVLKDTGEVEAGSEEFFTYRCLQSDKGRFRLTSATTSSRNPVRVLRSHSINSIWGPRAGIRYEGLYVVRGWSICAAKKPDKVNHQWEQGDIVYQVKFGRCDPVPMAEVLKRPTASEVDSYSEYKRIRRAHREQHHHHQHVSPLKDVEILPKAAPPIPPGHPTHSLRAGPGGLQRPALSPSVKSPSLKMAFDQPRVSSTSPARSSPGLDLVSPKTVPRTNPVDRLARVAQSPTKHPWSMQDTKNLTFSKQLIQFSLASSKTSSAQTGHTGGSSANIRDVAPWVELDPDMALALTSSQPRSLISNNSQTRSFMTANGGNGVGIHPAPRTSPQAQRGRERPVALSHTSSTWRKMKDRHRSRKSHGSGSSIARTDKSRSPERSMRSVRTRKGSNKSREVGTDGVDEDSDDVFGPDEDDSSTPGTAEEQVRAILMRFSFPKKDEPASNDEEEEGSDVESKSPGA